MTDFVLSQVERLSASLNVPICVMILDTYFVFFVYTDILLLSVI